LIALLSLFHFQVGYYFGYNLLHKLSLFINLICCFVHTLPFFPNRKTHVIGWVKIYIVALCWVGVTLVLPLLNANVSLN
jgi:hypothetical protein